MKIDKRDNMSITIYENNVITIYEKHEVTYDLSKFLSKSLRPDKTVCNMNVKIMSKVTKVTMKVKVTKYRLVIRRRPNERQI